jgi:hypothetical protein
MNPNVPTDLLERYLHAVGEHFPAATREDVLAELRANLQAQIDDRSEELNRALTDPEVAAILKVHGRPIVVAARYLPQQYLIGPAIFPYYLMTLRRAAPLVLVICFLAQSSRLLYVHTLGDLISGILFSLGRVIPDLIVITFWITLAFAIAEYTFNHHNAKVVGFDWDPGKLPVVRPPFQGKSWASRIVDLIFHCLFIAYVLEVPSHPFLIFGPSEIYLHKFSMAFASTWHTYYILLLLLLVFQLITKIFAVIPDFDRWQSPFELFTKLFGLAAAAFLATMKTYIVGTGLNANLTAISMANYWIGLSFRIVLVLALVDLLVAVWKVIHRSLHSRSLVFLIHVDRLGGWSCGLHRVP